MVGEVATNRLLVVLNKIDLLPAAIRDRAISKAQRMLLKTFAHTKFGRPLVVSISAKPGDRRIEPDKATDGLSGTCNTEGLAYGLQCRHLTPTCKAPNAFKVKTWQTELNMKEAQKL